MRYKLLAAGLLLVGIVVSSIYPLRYYYAEKALPPLPDYTDYDSALATILSQKIADGAREHRCKGYLIPVVEVEGDKLSFPQLVDDINLVLANATKCTLVVSERTAREMRARFDEVLRMWPGMFSGKELERMLQREKEGLFPKYSAKAKAVRLVSSEGEDVQLIVSINNERTRSRLFQAAVTFLHPETEKQWNTERDAKLAEIRGLEKGARIGINGIGIFAGLLILLGVVAAGSSFYQELRRRKQQELVLSQIQMREELVQNGHFVAALELADRYLALFPDDVEIQAFRERLLDFTNNDPKKAQVAYVEAKKMQSRLLAAQSNPHEALISQEEQRDLALLAPYNPDLQSAYHQLVALGEDYESRQRVASRLQMVEKWLAQGKIQSAAEELSNFPADCTDLPEVLEAKRKIEEINDDLARKINELRARLATGGLLQVEQALENLVARYPDFEDVKGLQREIELARGKSQFRIFSARRERYIHLHSKSQVVLGRSDVGIEVDIAVTDRRVSRPHARILIREDGARVEDLESTGGTFVNGKKIAFASLGTGDILSLAKVADFEISVSIDDNHVGGISLSGEDHDYLLVASRLSFDLDGNRIHVPGSNFIVSRNDDITVLSGPESTFLLYHECELVLDGTQYNVEVLQ